VLPRSPRAGLHISALSVPALTVLGSVLLDLHKQGRKKGGLSHLFSLCGPAASRGDPKLISDCAGHFELLSSGFILFDLYHLPRLGFAGPELFLSRPSQ